MKKIIIDLIANEVDLDVSEIENLVEVPPKDDMGDFAFPCFSLVKNSGCNPVKIAKDLAKKFKKELPKSISNVDFNGSYVNFFFDKKILAKKILKNVGKFRKQKGRKVMIEFSQANTHKAFHIGHIRGTSLGESLARILEFMGDVVVRVNYQGDTGMHVAKWIWCYNKYHKNEGLKMSESWIAGIYVDAVKRLSENEKFQIEVDDINRKLSSKEDRNLNDLWDKTRSLSLDALEIIYRDLNTKFDKYYFEGDIEQDGKKIVKDLIGKNIARVDKGATIVDLKKYGLGIWVLLRSDGTVLYSAKDIALAKRKFIDYSLDRSIYVHGSEQNLHMSQLTQTLRLMKFKDVEKIKYRSYGLVRLPNGKMSSRTGDNILYSDFKREIVDYVKKGILDRMEVGEKVLNERALKIAIAAIKYSMLKQDTGKMIVFDKKSALNFEGDTGPYLLYSYARASSIVRKVDNKNIVKISDLEDLEIKLLKKIDLFDEVVRRAYVNLTPNSIANYSFDLAQIFNEFYHACPVLGSKNEGLRLKIVNAFRVTLKKSLELLGIDTIEEM